MSEMRYHTISPTGCPAHTLAALCAGVVLGLWIPRRVIRQRLARGPVNAGQASPTGLAEPHGLKLEFAASLAGALVLAFALTWVVLGGGMVLMEGYRAFLVRRFAHPAWLTQLLLSGPALGGLVVTGAIGTTLLVALHGWYRLVTQPKAPIARLWAGILLGALAAGMLAAHAGSTTVLAGLAPLTVFLAGVVAVLRRSDAVGMSTPPPTRHRPMRDETLSLLTAGLAAALVAGALVLAIPPAGVASGRLAVGVGTLAGAAGAGLVAARLIARLRLSVDLAPLVLLLTSIALLFPYHYVLAASVNVALLRLALVTGWAAACIVLIGQQVEQARHSIQYSLSWVGRAVATGLGLTLLLLPIAAARWGPFTGVMIVSLVAAAGAGLALMLGNHVNPVMRVTGVTCVVLWLAGMPLARRAVPRTLPPPASASQLTLEPLAAAVRQLLTTDAFQTACVRPLPPSPAGATGWQFDLAGSALDLIILESVSEADDALAPGEHWERRLLKRLGTRLAQGGRLLVELPAPAGLIDAVNEFGPAPGCPAWTGYRLRMYSATAQYEALVFGRDIPALIARNKRTSEFQVALRPLQATPDGDH